MLVPQLRDAGRLQEALKQSERYKELAIATLGLENRIYRVALVNIGMC